MRDVDLRHTNITRLRTYIIMSVPSDTRVIISLFLFHFLYLFSSPWLIARKANERLLM